jgi:hypothetical protein
LTPSGEKEGEMKVRGKFKVQSVRNHATCGDGVVYAEVVMSAEYSGTPEDNSYSKATPTASLTMAVTVPEVVDTFKPGAYFYVDFTPIER